MWTTKTKLYSFFDKLWGVLRPSVQKYFLSEDR